MLRFLCVVAAPAKAAAAKWPDHPRIDSATSLGLGVAESPEYVHHHPIASLPDCSPAKLSKVNDPIRAGPYYFSAI